MNKLILLLKNKKGMTLIEIILSITILSILLLIVVPESNIILKIKERKELLEFKTDLNYARNKAICDGIRYSIKLFPRNNFYYIYKYERFPELVAKKEFKSGIRIENTNFNGSLNNKPSEVMFTSTGAPSIGGRIIIRNKKNEKNLITVEPATGKVNLYFNGE